MPSGVKDIQLLELKDTISQLNNTINTQNELIASLQKTLEVNKSKEEEKDRIIANLQAQLEFLKTKLFGSTSEVRHDLIPGQLNLFNNEFSDEKTAEIIEPEVIKVSGYSKERKPKATYEEIFENLPAKQVLVDTLTEEEKQCSICGTQMVSIGHEVIRTELVYTEPKLERIEYVATTYACPNCKDTEEDAPFVKDNGPKPLIPGSYVSSGLAAHVMYYKYMMSVPLYRMEKDFEHLGAKISRTTMASWIIYCSKHYFEPMFDFFHRKLLTRRYLMADETPIQVLKEPDRRAQTKSYVWLVRTGDDGEIPIILYNYTPTRAGKNAAAFLKGAGEGFFLMTDGYQGYNKVPDAQRCCCWAHIRRYWLKAIPKGHESDYTHPAVQGLLYCNKLFEYERSYREKGLSLKQIYKRRLKDEKPVIEAFLAWLDNLHPQTGDSITKAITYSQNCRPYMMNYLKDGACSLSNNLSENSIRPVVMGRKNWLFSDTPDGANASMKIFSMIETAKANGVDPLKYLSFLLEHRPSTEMTDDELETFAPWSELAQETCK
jgi:transposase